MRLLAPVLLALSLAACDTSSLTTTTTEQPIVPNTPTTTTIAGQLGTVTALTDGDTLKVDGVATRLLEVDTPETVHPTKPVQCFGPEASQHLKDLLPAGTQVRVVADKEDKDRYGRNLRYVYRASDNLFVNAELVEDGYAKVLIFQPNTAHENELVDLEAQAKAAKRGLWGACNG